MARARYKTSELMRVGTAHLPEIARNVGDALRYLSDANALAGQVFAGKFVAKLAWLTVAEDSEGIVERTATAVRESADAMVVAATRYAQAEEINMRLPWEAYGGTGWEGSE